MDMSSSQSQMRRYVCAIRSAHILLLVNLRNDDLITRKIQ